MATKQFIPIKQAAADHGVKVTDRTLRRWADDGHIDWKWLQVGARDVVGVRLDQCRKLCEMMRTP